MVLSWILTFCKQGFIQEIWRFLLIPMTVAAYSRRKTLVVLDTARIALVHEATDDF